MINKQLTKMRIKAPHVLVALNAPAAFLEGLSALPQGISAATDRNKADSIHWFVKNKKEVDKEAAGIIKQLRPGVVVWCYYPKGSSGMQTDLTRDKGWETLLAYDFKWLNLVSFDDIWSAFAFRLKTEADAKKPVPPREILNYADPATKTIILPADVKKTLGSDKKAQGIFESLAFSHKREYIEWIVTAKKEETRNNRISRMLTMLTEGKKNPAQK